MPQNQRQDRDPAALLSIAAIAAVALACLLVAAVLGDPDFASKLENGAAPPGADETGARTAAVAGIIAAVGAWTAAIASRRVIPILLVLLATAPFAPLALFTLVLAF